MKQVFRGYFWNKRWYKHLVLYKLRQFLGMSYLHNGWHTKSELEYLMTDLRRIEKKIDLMLDK